MWNLLAIFFSPQCLSSAVFVLRALNTENWELCDRNWNVVMKMLLTIPFALIPIPIVIPWDP